MADDLHDASDYASSDASNDDADNAWVSDLLRESTESLADTPAVPMPPEVWAQLENALEAERVVVPLGRRRRGRSRRGRGRRSARLEYFTGPRARGW